MVVGGRQVTKKWPQPRTEWTNEKRMERPGERGIQISSFLIPPTTHWPPKAEGNKYKEKGGRVSSRKCGLEAPETFIGSEKFRWVFLSWENEGGTKQMSLSSIAEDREMNSEWMWSGLANSRSSCCQSFFCHFLTICRLSLSLERAYAKIKQVSQPKKAKIKSSRVARVGPYLSSPDICLRPKEKFAIERRAGGKKVWPCIHDGKKTFFWL